MELPFAVDTDHERDLRQDAPLHREASTNGGMMARSLDQSDSSLVTASSQGSGTSASQSYKPFRPKETVPSPLPVSRPFYVPSAHPSSDPPSLRSCQTPHQAAETPEIETVDFTFVWESDADDDEVDILIGGQPLREMQRGNSGGRSAAVDNAADHTRDLLTVLLGYHSSQFSHNVVEQSIVQPLEKAQDHVAQAQLAKQNGKLQEALNHHVKAARLFHEVAGHMKMHNASLTSSLLLLSQTHAKAGLRMQRITKLRPGNAASSTSGMNADQKSSASIDRTKSSTNPLLERVRGALGTIKPEQDISASMFLGRSASKAMEAPPALTTVSPHASEASNQETDHSNPIDKVMQLERELKNMDMALELGHSIASLDARQQSRMSSKNSVAVDGSFMVVPFGSSSFMSSSALWSPQPGAPAARRAVSGGKAKDRLHNFTADHNRQPHYGATFPPCNIVPAAAAPNVSRPHHTQSLESSWWGALGSTPGSASVGSASQLLSSSIMSNHTLVVGPDTDSSPGGSGATTAPPSPANTKQLMRLMDSLKVLGDENAALLREVEGADKARREAQAAREQMRRFKKEYADKFVKLKEALEKFRKGYPNGAAGTGTASPASNPMATSEFVRSAMNSDQLQRQEKMIRELTTALEKEKSENKRKSVVLSKYEEFYREVKARSAQKTRQREQEQALARQQPGKTTT